METINYTTAWGTEFPVFFKLGNYINNGNLHIRMLSVSKYGLEPYMDITCNIKIVLQTNTAAVKNYNENEGLADWLVKNKLAEYTESYIASDFMQLPVMKFNLEKIKEFVI